MALGGAALYFGAYLIGGAYVPARLESAYIASLNDIGVARTEYSRKLKTGNQLHIYGLDLDEDSFSVIPKTYIDYNPLSIFSATTTQKIELKSPRLSADFNDIYNIKPIGFSFKPLNSSLDIDAKNIVFDKLKLEMLSPDLGGITLSSDLQLFHDENGYALQGTLNTVQQPLRFDAVLNGNLNSENLIIDAALSDIKFLNGEIKAARGNGTASLSGRYPDNLNLTADLQFGGFSIHGLAAQNINLSINKSADRFLINASGRGLNAPDIELSYQYGRIADKSQTRYTLFTPDIKMLDDYLVSMGLDADLSGFRDNMRNIQIVVNQQSAQGRSIIVTIKTGNKVIGAGKLENDEITLQNILDVYKPK